MKVKKLKELLEKIDDDIDVEVGCSQWGSAISTVTAYLDKENDKPVFCIIADNDGM